MRRILIVLVAFLALSIVTHYTLAAQTASASLSVTANVSKNCTITTSPVNFGAYDPVSANSTSPLDGTGTVTVACTKGASAHVGLSNGSNNQGSTRRMRQSGTAFLNYEIYRDASRTNVWGDDYDNNLDIGSAPNRNPRSFTVYGRVQPAQDATVGSYSDVVVATVNF